MSFAERLKDERKRVGLTQAQLAKIGGVTATSQNEYENPEKDRTPNAKYLASIAETGIDIGLLITGQPSGAALPSEEAALIKLFRAASREEQGMILRMVAAAVGQTARAKPKASELLPEHVLLHKMFSTLLRGVELSDGKESIAEYLADMLPGGIEVIEDGWTVTRTESAEDQPEEAPARKRA